MSKPTSLTKAEIADIQMRLRKGWVVRAFEYEPLIAMAIELIETREGANAAPATPALSYNSGYQVRGNGMPTP